MRYTKYDERGAVHWREYERGYNYKLLVDDSLPIFDKVEKGTLIDVGCGDGCPTCKLAEMGFKVTGVDIERTGLELAFKRCNQNVEWVCASIEDFIKKGREFDYLYSLNTIEHLKEPSIMVLMMKFVKRFAIIITDDADVSKKGNPFHEKEYTRESFKKLFKGFKMEEMQLRDKRFFGYKIYSKCVS